MSSENPNVVGMLHVIAENYMERPLPDPSIQNDNTKIKGLVSDIIKLVEQGGFNSLLGEAPDVKMEELKVAVPELINTIVTGRNMVFVQNDNANIKRSR